MMDRSTDTDNSGGGNGHHHYKIAWCASPKGKKYIIIYPLKPVNMFMVTDKTSLLTFDNATHLGI